MKIISMMISLIIVLSNMTIAFAEDMVKTYRFEDDITMNGVISSTEKLFKVSDNWSVNDAKLNLNFSKSKILDADYSTITVLINGTPIHSQKLDGKEEYKEELVVSIPKDKIKNGYNSLAIKAYKTISDVVCRDDSNTANWLVVNKGSSINIKYAYNKPQNLISEYPNIFTEVDEADNLNTTIVVPTTYLNSEISSAINLSADIGKKLKHENFKLNIKYESEINNENKNIIYIGSLENTSDKILNTFTKEELGNLNNKCIIKV
ncbi:MAG: cellulose biosynthesis cyclic di-GMP-binding regulatory protein BcsB, partial [Peptostreptococcaceae bacterium]